MVLTQGLPPISALHVLSISLTSPNKTSVMDALQSMNCHIHSIKYDAKGWDIVVDTALKMTMDAVLIDTTAMRPEAYQLASQLRHDCQLDVPIILVGDFHEASERVAALRNGASLCLDSTAVAEEVQLLLNYEVETYHRLRTLQNQYQAEIDELQEKLASKNEFIQTLSHDMKNPLSVIYGSASLIKQQSGDMEPLSQDALDNILSAAQDMRKLLLNLLNLEKMEGSQELDYEPILFLGFLSSCVDSYQAVAESNQIKLIFEQLSADKTVEFDHDRMIHALGNLISNALKYTAQGGTVTVTGSIEGEMAKVTVTDTGIGIPEDDLPHIFKRFFRAQSARQHSGTGLGLAITKAIIEKHHGTIEVESILHQGTTFAVILPLKQPRGAM
jgi:signal transduction histidine kinase